MAEQIVTVTGRCRTVENPSCCTVPHPQQVPENPAPRNRELYDIQSLIGLGGRGTVYSGTRVADGRQVALKYIHKDMVSRWGVLNGCNVPVEFLYLHTLSKSPGIIQMLDWFKQNDVYVLVMERTPHATDLDDLLDDQGPFPEDLCRYVFHQVANTIQHCHENQIVHRDIKVENILINALTHEVKVIDFGCGTKLKNIPELRLCGTAIFYPPEWYINECYYGDRLDMWCLGIVLYMMVEGEEPFSNEEEIVNCKVHHCRGKKFSKSYKNLIKSLLNEDPEKRPSLDDVLADPWLHADSEQPESRKKRGLFRLFRRFFKR